MKKKKVRALNLEHQKNTKKKGSKNMHLSQLNNFFFCCSNHSREKTATNCDVRRVEKHLMEIKYWRERGEQQRWRAGGAEEVERVGVRGGEKSKCVSVCVWQDVKGIRVREERDGERLDGTDRDRN